MVKNKSGDQAGTRATILFSTGIPASGIYLNNRRILYIFTGTGHTVAVDTPRGRGKNEPLGALTTKWHAKGATFQPRMEYKIRTWYVKRINLIPYPGQGWNDAPPNKLSRDDSPSNLKKKKTHRVERSLFLITFWSRIILILLKKRNEIFIVAHASYRSSKVDRMHVLKLENRNLSKFF